MSALQVKIISMFHAFIGTSFRMANLWLPDFKVLRELTSSWTCSFNSHSFLTYLYLLRQPDSVSFDSSDATHSLLSCESTDYVSPYIFLASLRCVLEANSHCPGSILLVFHTPSRCSGCGQDILVPPQHLVSWSYFCNKVMYYQMSE